jgi:hypothetical protein
LKRTHKVFWFIAFWLVFGFLSIKLGLTYYYALWTKDIVVYTTGLGWQLMLQLGFLFLTLLQVALVMVLGLVICTLFIYFGRLLRFVFRPDSKLPGEYIPEREVPKNLRAYRQYSK